MLLMVPEQMMQVGGQADSPLGLDLVLLMAQSRTKMLWKYWIKLLGWPETKLALLWLDSLRLTHSVISIPWKELRTQLIGYPRHKQKKLLED